MKRYGIIYKITNLKNGKVYIGQTNSNFNRRYDHKGCGIERVYNKYKWLKENGYSYNDYLLKSIEKYGFGSFEVEEEFDSAFTKEELDIKEIYWIKKFNSTDRKCGYNIMAGGNACKHSKETIEKIRRSKLNMSDETKKKMSEKAKLRPKRFGKDNYMYGKTPWNKGIKRTDIDGEKNARAIKVICLNTLEIFNCAKYGADKYNLKAHQMIGTCCRGKQKTCGKDEEGNKLHWLFLEDYKLVKNMTLEEIHKFKVDKYIKQVNTEVSY